MKFAILKFAILKYAILQKVLNLGFQDFKPIVLRMYFLSVATFFSQVMVICLPWYLYFKDASLGFNILFNIWRKKHKSITFFNLEPVIRNSENRIVCLKSLKGL